MRWRVLMGADYAINQGKPQSRTCPLDAEIDRETLKGRSVHPLLEEVRRIKEVARRGSALDHRFVLDPPVLLCEEPDWKAVLGEMSASGVLVLLGRTVSPGGRRINYVYRPHYGARGAVMDEICGLEMDHLWLQRDSVFARGAKKAKGRGR